MRQVRFDFKFGVGVLCLGAVVLLALLGGVVSGHDPTEQNLLMSLQPPGDFSGGYYLGTDHLGRDILSRMASGAQVSLAIALSVVALSGAVGVSLGALSGYVSGVRDVVIQKVVETIWAFPPILLAIAVMAFFGASLGNVIVALTLQRWIPYCRLARAQALALSSREYVAASKVMGAGAGWVLTRHIVPNLVPAAIVIGTFTMATAILAESSLSFLGLGVPPGTPTWGGMLAEGRSYVSQAWWLAVFPGMGIFLTVLGLNLVGDWLRDTFDPKRHSNVL
ncbi:ABC transporter permease subunit [Bordetella petrii]|nr:ABC transporter permease subunit [Bordetella petrii]